MTLRARFVSLVLCLVIIQVLIVMPVSGNPVPRERSIRLYLENEGLPFEDSVNFSMDCYGHFSVPTDHHELLRSRTDADPNPPEKVFILSGTCPVYGCMHYISTRSPPDDYWEPESSRYCRINVTTFAGNSVIVWNRTDERGIVCSNRSDQWDMERKTGKTTLYYNFTPEYASCKEGLDALGEVCQDYFENGSRGDANSTMTHNQCIQLYDHTRSICYASLQQINASSVRPAQYYCRFTFDLPKSIRTVNGEIQADQNRTSSASPVESLYCTVLSVIGLRC